MPDHKVLFVNDCSFSSLSTLLKRYQLDLVLVEADEEIPGTYWGDSEAGLIGNKVYVRNDTPIHSALHESCHFICMDQSRRDNLDTNAEGDYDEENGVCFLQILLSNDLTEMGQERMLQDMDSWGYTFRLGSAKKWFEEDAEDAEDWLLSHGILRKSKQISYKLRH